MKKISSILVLALMALMLASCGSTKNIAYFQNSDSIYYEKSRMLYDAHIMPKDQLTITVSTTNQEATLQPDRPDSLYHGTAHFD